MLYARKDLFLHKLGQVLPARCWCTTVYQQETVCDLQFWQRLLLFLFLHVDNLSCTIWANSLLQLAYVILLLGMQYAKAMMTLCKDLYLFVFVLDACQI